jgi:hypothetical protein
LLVRRDVFEALGGMDAANFPSRVADIDFGLKVRAAGHQIMWTPYATLQHDSDGTTQGNRHDNDALLAKWGSRAMGQRSRASLVGGFDRGLGAGFGAVKGLLIASIGFMLVTLLYDIGYGNAQRPAWMTDSRTYPALNATSTAMSKVIADRRAEARQAEAEAGKDKP